MIATDDRILLGEGLFETLKVVNARPCFARLHWQRLMHSVSRLDLNCHLSYDDWYGFLLTQIRQGALQQGGIKVLLSGGSAARGLLERGQTPQLIAQTFTYQPRLAPLRLTSAPWLRDAANPVYQMKTVSYLEAIMARRQAHSLEADDALFFNTEQQATETTCANLFILTGQQFITPGLNQGIIPGITRARILSLCQQHQLVCSEKPLTKIMLQTADAVFVTNALQGIQRVCAWDEVSFSTEHPLIERLVTLLALDELNDTENHNRHS